MEPHRPIHLASPDPAPSLSPIQQNIVRLEQEAAQKRAELDAALKNAQAIQRTLSGLQRDVDNCSDQLIRADGQNVTFKNAIETVKATFLEAWGKTTHIDGDTTPPDYSHLAAFKEAIADYPRVRAHLQEKLTKAQALLTNFIKDNNL